ncbi:MAG: HAMP domain-containing histidine kinase [Akkermansiaceae bacterium]|jgi:signal transduction histidine kinase|nr:HAMP domain-containing histidine kinase [Akkermansiaceae bacterium]
MPRPSSSLHWLTLAVLLPLLVLGVLAWLGTRAQVKAAWSVAREEAKVAGAFVGEALPRELSAAVEAAPLFPDPPQPGVASAGDAVLDGNDLDALRKLRDDPAAGLSPAGLPRRVLAGFRVFEQTRDEADARVLTGLATVDAPSVLTPLVFEKVGEPDWRARWSRGDHARAIFRHHPDVPSSGKWIIGGDETWWLSSDGKELRFIAPAAFQQALASAAGRLPAWAGLRLSLGGTPVAGGSSTGEIMNASPISFGNGLALEILAARPALFEAAARHQARWTLGLLAFAVVISGGALFFIHRAVERERRLNAMKSDFVASVSHELRAPVASIRLMADALNAGKIEPHTVSEFHRLISREGARLTTLIENVLDFARIEQGRKRWHFEDCDLAQVITETVNLMEPLAAEKSITLVSPKPLPSLVAQVDPGAIQQALVNLLENAIKFSPAGSQVEILLTESSANWEIQITDQGPGIPSAEHARIFEKFHRLGSELRRETQGTGIGLSLVKAVAEAHGGRVELTSTVGKGSVFNLIAPLLRPLKN